jgi:hypothetical protein
VLCVSSLLPSPARAALLVRRPQCRGTCTGKQRLGRLTISGASAFCALTATTHLREVVDARTTATVLFIARDAIVAVLLALAYVCMCWTRGRGCEREGWIAVGARG